MAIIRSSQHQEEREFPIVFDIGGKKFEYQVTAYTEEQALNTLKNQLLEMVADITLELNEEVDDVAPKVKVIKKKANTVTTEVKPNVISGIVINQPKKVNDPGFQPKFREQVD